jgi:phage terminase large subunit-like protein
VTAKEIFTVSPAFVVAGLAVKVASPAEAVRHAVASTRAKKSDAVVITFMMALT